MDTLTIVLVILVCWLIIDRLITFIQCIRTILAICCCFKKINLKNTYGDWAVITGCTDGIGKEYAKELAKRGLNLVLISRSLMKLETTKDEIETINSSINIEIIQADFSKGREELETIKNKLENIPVGILVNNVGVFYEYPMYLDEYPEDKIWNLININISTLTIMSRMVIEKMKKNGKGAIVNISSASSIIPLPLLSVYSASKSYVNFFSKATRKEYANSGLTIQCLIPYFINTKMTSYSPRLKLSGPLFPDAATYARNAIETLGKLDFTTGYWLFDISYFLQSMLPSFLQSALGCFTVRLTRYDYFKDQKEKHGCIPTRAKADGFV